MRDQKALAWTWSCTLWVGMADHFFHQSFVGVQYPAEVESDAQDSTRVVIYSYLSQSASVAGMASLGAHFHMEGEELPVSHHLLFFQDIGYLLIQQHSEGQGSFLGQTGF